MRTQDTLARPIVSIVAMAALALGMTIAGSQLFSSAHGGAAVSGVSSVSSIHTPNVAYDM